MLVVDCNHLATSKRQVTRWSHVIGDQSMIDDLLATIWVAKRLQLLYQKPSSGRWVVVTDWSLTICKLSGGIVVAEQSLNGHDRSSTTTQSSADLPVAGKSLNRLPLVAARALTGHLVVTNWSATFVFPATFCVGCHRLLVAHWSQMCYIWSEGVVWLKS